MADATCILNGGFKPTMKRFADLSGPDFFPTPAWATFALKVEPKLFDRCTNNFRSRAAQIIDEIERPIRRANYHFSNSCPTEGAK